MKRNYETRARRFLTRRIPVIIRVDGKCYHTLTKNLKEPFDFHLKNAMDQAAIALCKNISGTKIAYVQSDEISLLLTDYDTLTTEPYCDYNQSKLESISASIAAVNFTLNFQKAAYFDSRSFNIPKEEVNNYFFWRQLDATRNSVQSMGYNYFSHRDLMNKNIGEVKAKLRELGLPWEDIPVSHQRGRCVVKVEQEDNRTDWVVDNDIPVFCSDINYIEQHVYLD